MRQKKNVEININKKEPDVNIEININKKKT
jgi:hypothetical protein